MADIVKAIEKEKEYLSYRMKGQESFHLIDAIKECGFENLDDYFKTKKEFEFGQLKFNIVEADTLSAITEVLKAIDTKQATVVMVDIDRTVVFPSDHAEYNAEYCIKNKIPILPVHTNGNGALVATDGDLGIGVCIPKINNIKYEDILEGLIKIFRKYTDKDICNDGNDLMYNGKKVCGFTFYSTDDVVMAITPISLSDKSELISKICKKKQTKVPGYVDFIDRTSLRQEVAKWLQVCSI